MGTNPNNAPNDPPCGTIAYRLILKPAWLDPDDESRVKAAAFMRRNPRDADGLSLFDSYRVDMQACIEGCRSCDGVVTLHVGTLLDLGLTVIRDPEDSTKILVTNMPFENPNDAAQESLLDSVADSARIAKRCRHRSKK